jgi:hypothetical protein
MRDTLHCKACASRKLWRVHPVLLPQFDSPNANYPMPAICRSSSGTIEYDLGKREQAGTFEIWICSACGLTEWYATNVNDTLQYLSRAHGSGVSLVDGDKTQAPYR